MSWTVCCSCCLWRAQENREHLKLLTSGTSFTCSSWGLKFHLQLVERWISLAVSSEHFALKHNWGALTCPWELFAGVDFSRELSSSPVWLCASAPWLCAVLLAGGHGCPPGAPSIWDESPWYPQSKTIPVLLSCRHSSMTWGFLTRSTSP